jgi:hypothetical protein
MEVTLVQFTLIVSIHHRQREVNLRKRNAELYNANVSDERGDRHYFDIISVDGRWQFKEQAMPAWLKENEASVIDKFTLHIEE